MTCANVRALCTLMAVGTAALGMWACPKPDPQPDDNSATLSLLASPKTLPADGTTTDLSVVATEASGAVGTGQVTLSAPRGSLGSPGTTEVLLNLSNGHASVKYSCDAAKESACSGTQQITASWKDATATTKVTFVGAAAPDAGHSNDGGALDAGGTDAGGIDAGTDAGARDAGSSIDTGYVVTVSAAKASIYSHVGDSTAITATIAKAGMGVAGEQIELTTDIDGLYIPTDGGVAPDPTARVILTSDSMGAATARFGEGKEGTPGLATIRATHTASGASATTSVNVLAVSTITYKGMTCNGTPCTMLGLKGSGWNEQGDLVFQVLDAASKPIAGFPVTFDFINKADVPYETTLEHSGTTDFQGYVKTRICAGGVIGVATIMAVAIPSSLSPVQAVSPTIGIRGAKPSAVASKLQCSPVNIPAYISPHPPASYQIACKVKLLDRYNNPVGTGAQVYFKAEAGGITNSIATTPFNPASTNPSEGEGTATFSTTGLFPAKNVSPLPADPNQWPEPRPAEPSMAITQDLVANPRDGLVTIIAYTAGEEHFYDTNGNGIHDPEETFVDQSTPFVDVDDDGIFDARVGDMPVNGAYAPPNKTWDKDTTIWMETRVLYTDLPSHASLTPSQFGPVEVGGRWSLDAFFVDANLNYPASTNFAQTSFSVSHSATRGSVVLPPLSIEDQYGFDILMDDQEKNVVSATDSGPCCPSKLSAGCAQRDITPICKKRVLFRSWSAKMGGPEHGYISNVTVVGAPLGATEMPVTDVVTVRAIVVQINAGSASATGIIK